MRSWSRPGLRWSRAIWECPDRRPSGPVFSGKSQTWTGTAGFGLVQTGSQSVWDRTSPTLVERQGHVGRQGGSVGNESTWRGCMMAADRGWVGSWWFCGAMHAQCACEHDEWQWDGGWKGWWQQDRERSSNRKESMVEERRALWWQGEHCDGRRERAVMVAQRRLRWWHGEGCDSGTEKAATVAQRSLRWWHSRSHDCSKACSLVFLSSLHTDGCNG